MCTHRQRATSLSLALAFLTILACTSPRGGNGSGITSGGNGTTTGTGATGSTASGGGTGATSGVAGGVSIAPVSGQGQLALALVDAPASQAKEIWVTVTQVTAHSSATGWVPVPMVATAPFKVDLLKLQDAAVDLGFLNLPAGANVTQIRLLVDDKDGSNYVILPGGTEHVPLKVPSGSQSGIKIKGSWTITECGQTKITLDFDGKKSIFTHPAHQSTEWILRPVIRVKATDTAPIPCTETPPPGTETPPVTPVTPPAPVGQPCAADADCLTATCGADNVCAPGPVGAPCVATADCAGTATCTDLTCTSPSTTTPPSCTADGQCPSGFCDNGTCAPGSQGTPCTLNTDCQEGLTCTTTDAGLQCELLTPE